MQSKRKEKNYEKAYEDYVLGMKYKDIGLKYGVSENTVKSWRKRYGWQRTCTQNKVQNETEVRIKTLQLREKIKTDLVSKIKERDFDFKVYLDLIDDYMEFWDIKNKLINDIKTRGVVVEWNNGRQEGEKKNDSIAELVKVNNQMLKILSELSLKPSKFEDGDDDDI